MLFVFYPAGADWGDCPLWGPGNELSSGSQHRSLQNQETQRVLLPARCPVVTLDYNLVTALELN